MLQEKAYESLVYVLLAWESKDFSCPLTSRGEMKLGRESEYAVAGLLALAKIPFGTTMLLRDIAISGKVPQSFLAKIFQKLARAGILRSSRGAIRGYALARKPNQVKVKEIFLAIEGPDLFERCIFWRERCADSNPCSKHFRWKRMRNRVIGELMERTTLADIANRRRIKPDGG